MSDNFICGHRFEPLHHPAHHRRTAAGVLRLLLCRWSKLVLHALVAGELSRRWRHPAGNHHSTTALNELLRERLGNTHLRIFPGGVANTAFAGPQLFRAIYQNLNLLSQLGLDGENNHKNAERDGDQIQLAVLVPAVRGNVGDDAVHEIYGHEHEEELSDDFH